MINGIDNNLLAGKLGGVGTAAKALGAGGGASFAETLKNTIEQVARSQQDPSKAVQGLTAGRTQDVASAITAMEKSDAAFQTLLAIRSTLMNAYEEIKNISV